MAKPEGYFTGKNSKLARLIEEAIRTQCPVEVDLANRETIYGTIDCYELSSQQFFIVIKTDKGTQILNNRFMLKMRMPKTNYLLPNKLSKQ